MAVLRREREREKRRKGGRERGKSERDKERRRKHFEKKLNDSLTQFIKKGDRFIHKKNAGNTLPKEKTPTDR